jgi:adenosylcobinamide kinase / adenosylcobinamide-phosphate guanylyltransferase
MFRLIIGASGSGKSEYAEQQVISSPCQGKRIYIATMQPWDEECERRIEKHQRARAGRGFRTIERYQNLAGLDLPEGSNVLLECLSNLVANEIYAPDGGGKEAVLEGIWHLFSQCKDLTIVTNEVFSGGSNYEGDTLFYLKELAEINRILAKKADQVVEVICSCPNVLKGK